MFFELNELQPKEGEKYLAELPNQINQRVDAESSNILPVYLNNYYGHLTPKNKIMAESLIGHLSNDFAPSPLSFVPITDFQSFQTHICYTFAHTIFVASLSEEMNWVALKSSTLSFS